MTIIPTASRHVPKVSASFPESENGPTPERMRHALSADGKVMGHTIDIRDHDITWQAYHINDGPLAKLHFLKHPKISHDQMLAGERYYTVVLFSGLIAMPHTDTTRIVVDGKGENEMADYRVAAIKKFNKIHTRMDYNLCHIVNSLVVEGIGLAEYAERFRSVVTGGVQREVKEKRVRQGIALDRLHMGLDYLIREFGMDRPRAAIVGSRTERPTIQPSQSTA